MVFAGLALLTGGSVARVDRTLEVSGGVLVWLLARIPFVAGAAAVTLGHVILGRAAGDLALARAHERVHVRQYERWGPFFLPAYFGCSAWLWLVGKDPYRDNPFEIEAYETDDNFAA